MFVGSDAGAPFAALKRMLRVASVLAVDAGIRLDMFKVFAEIAVHLVPFVLNSMRFDTPATVSVRVSKASPVGKVVEAVGTETDLTFDDGTDDVARVLTITVVAALPKTLLGIPVAGTETHDDPLLRLYSIEAPTPVIESEEPL